MLLQKTSVTFWGHVHLFGSQQIHVHLVVHSAVTQHLHDILGKWSHVQYTFLVLYRYIYMELHCTSHLVNCKHLY